MVTQMRFASGLRVVAVLALAAALASCGSDTALPPMTVVTPQPVHVVLTNPPVIIGDFASGTWQSVPFPLSTAGALDITVDWTFPESWLYIYFGDTVCDYNQLEKRQCPFLISSETQLPKPRVLKTGELKAGTYNLVLYNVPWDVRTGVGSDNTETVAIQIGLTISPSGDRQSVRLGRPITVRPTR